MNPNVKAPRITRLAIAALVSGGMGMAGFGLAPVTAHADPNTDWGPAKHWCPGEPLPPTGNHVTDPIHDWNSTVCHTYYYLWPGMGNVSHMIWDGDNPPPKPPPPPALISTREQCEAILGIFCPKA
jgi:hypothetical protein